MIRNFLALLVVFALAIAAGGLACGDPANQPDKDDEGEGAT